MKWTKPVLLIAVSCSLHQAMADDLESILSSGDTTPQADVAKPEAAKLSPLVSAMKNAVGTLNSEQNVFFRYLEAADWEEATLQFPNAFEGTAFQKSANGRALQGLVQFRAGLPIAGVQTLFLTSAPKDIHGLLQEEWRVSAPIDHYVWALAKVPWKTEWENVLGLEHGLRVRAEEVLARENPSIEELDKLSAQAPTNSKLKGRIDWQLAVAYSLKDQGDKAGTVLARLMKNPKAPVSKDLMQLTAARLLFQNGYFDSAIKYYDNVSKNSDYWSEAQEEMAWAYIRKGQPNNAKAISQSLVNSGIAYMATPESFFIRSLAELKVCDYKGVMATLEDFSKRFKSRTINLENQTKDANTPEVLAAIAQLQNGRIKIQDLGKNATKLPRRFAHDEKLYEFAQAQKHLSAEAAVAEKMYATSLALTGLQGSFENIKQATLQRAEGAKSASMARVKTLAQTELEETKEILRKMHIVEAEVIQQVSLADKIAKNAAAKPGDEKKGVTGYKGTEALRFPAENEVWFDELSNYRVDVKKACTVKKL